MCTLGDCLREHADLVAARGQVADRDVLAAVDEDGDAGERIGVGSGVGAAQRDAGEVDRDVRAADR